MAYHRTYGLPATISRCSNNYGPYHFPEKLIPLMITRALADDKPLPVYGEGLNVRDWLYVEDHCSAIDLIIHKGRVGEVYNIGGHNERTNMTGGQDHSEGARKAREPDHPCRPTAQGHDMRYAIDPTKIHSELGWLPKTTFDEGIKKTVDWYLDNRRVVGENILSGEYQNYFEKMYGGARDGGASSMKIPGVAGSRPRCDESAGRARPRGRREQSGPGLRRHRRRLRRDDGGRCPDGRDRTRAQVRRGDRRRAARTR